MLAILIWGTLPFSAIAAENKPTAKQDKAQAPMLETVKCRVRVIDADGKPIAGAVVAPSGFRTIARPGTHWGWGDKRFGPQPQPKTDADGVAALDIPKFVIEKLEIAKVTWLVDHSSYVVYREDHDIGEDPAEIQLKDGYRIAATAVDAESGEPIKEHLFAQLSGYRMSTGREWKLAKSGILLSRVFDDEQFVLRLIHLPAGQPPKFSELIALKKPKQNERVFLKNIPLQSGTRVAGRLDDQVPRPVRGGKIIACVTASSPKDSTDHINIWRWSDWSDIKPDGSFVIESLPRGDVVQLIAVCDGWISSNPTKKEVAALPWKQQFHATSFTWPQLFPLNGETIEPTIKMSPAAMCEIEVLDPDGKRLADAEINMWPNHAHFRGGSTILGFKYRTAEWLQALAEGRDIKTVWNSRNPFMAKTSAEGIAVIRNLPGKPHIGLNATHENFAQQIENGRRSTNVTLKPGESTKITIRMEPKGANLLGE